MYLGYYHFAQLLFYRYLHLPNVPEYLVTPTSVGAYSYAERCRVNSTALCGTIYNAYATPGAEVYVSHEQICYLLFDPNPKSSWHIECAVLFWLY